MFQKFLPSKWLLIVATAITLFSWVLLLADSVNGSADQLGSSFNGTSLRLMFWSPLLVFVASTWYAKDSDSSSLGAALRGIMLGEAVLLIWLCFQGPTLDAIFAWLLLGTLFAVLPVVGIMTLSVFGTLIGLIIGTLSGRLEFADGDD